MPEPTPEAWVQIRHAYEHTSRPIVDICAEHGITDPMLRYRVKRWGWQKRRSLIPRQGPPATPPPVVAEAIEDLHPPAAREDWRAPGEAGCAPAWDEACMETPHPAPLCPADAWRGDLPPHTETEDSTAIVRRLKSAVTRLLPAIESVIARLASGPHSPRAMEQAARALGSLTRTLRELNSLLAQHQAGGTQGRCPCCDDMPEDLDAFRIQLADRIDALFASQQDDFGQDPPGRAAEPDAQARREET